MKFTVISDHITHHSYQHMLVKLYLMKMNMDKFHIKIPYDQCLTLTLIFDTDTLTVLQYVN